MDRGAAEIRGAIVSRGGGYDTHVLLKKNTIELRSSYIYIFNNIGLYFFGSKITLGYTGSFFFFV